MNDSVELVFCECGHTALGHDDYSGPCDAFTCIELPPKDDSGLCDLPVRRGFSRCPAFRPELSTPAGGDGPQTHV